MKMSRVWAMPNKNTFEIPPIGAFVQKYMRGRGVSIDPFARDCTWATWTNDLNPDTMANYHMDALEFLKMLLGKKVKADVVIFDPPYSPRQIKECYDGIGLKMGQEDAWRTAGWSKEKDVIAQLLTDKGVFLQFGWNTLGMCTKRGFKIVEIILVCHGAAHNDTICMAERREQMRLF